MSRVVILIDGQNLFYNLRHLGLLERDILWNKFFGSLISENDEISRTYWFRPQKISDGNYTSINIRNQICYKKHRLYLDKYLAQKYLVPRDVREQIESEATKVERWIRKEKDRFSQLEFNYDNISLEFGDIEVVKKGFVKIDPFKQVYLGEKGVDIALAVKMISLSIENKCDKIILISSDYDYAEAIKFIKNNMTKIHLVKIQKGFPPKNKSLSRDLAVLADKVIDIYESDIRKHFLKTQRISS